MLDNVPAKPRSKRGGRRPGAGAPKGNLNALRNGDHSQRFTRGLLMIALLPEVQAVLRALKAEDRRKHRIEFNKVMIEAIKVTEMDPVLAKTIKQVIQARIQKLHAFAEKLESKSNNQPELLRLLRARDET